jgi:3-hydroxybutyryl-CoA dehydrogenase
MRIAIFASEEQKKEILEKGFADNVEIVWLDRQHENLNGFDAVFDLLFDEDEIEKSILTKNIPVFANAVFTTAEKLPENYIRLNAWNGFLSRTIIEVAASNMIAKEKATRILKALNWDFVWSPDEPGLIAGRIIAMIINEAYFALAEDVSSKEEIDVAMKLGTNYPYGPFEWGKKIGIKNISQLLKELNKKDKRYEIAPLLLQECENL